MNLNFLCCKTAARFQRNAISSKNIRDFEITFSHRLQYSVSIIFAIMLIDLADLLTPIIPPGDNSIFNSFITGSVKPHRRLNTLRAARGKVCCVTIRKPSTKMEYQWLCPTVADCSWQGRSYEVLPHFLASHENLLLHSNSFSVDVTSNKKENRILCLGNDVYLVQTDVAAARRILELRLRYLGSHEEASAFSYNVQVCVGEAAFSSELDEICSAIHIKNGTVEVDLQMLDIIAGSGSVQHVSCTLDVKRDAREKQMQLETTPYEPQPVVEETTQNERSEPVEDHAPSSPAENNPEKASPVLRKASLIRNDSARLSFLGNYFYDDYISKQNKSADSASLIGSYSETDGKSSSSELQCATCLFEMCPPIFLCCEGHSVCGDCKLKDCGICSRSITDLRNTDLEDISTKLKHACMYAANGCTERHKRDEIAKHELHCNFCVYSCCFCSTKGKFSVIKSHLKLLHSSVKSYEYLKNKFPKNTSFLILNRDVGVFYCISREKGDTIEWSVTYCGPKERWFACVLKFKRKREVSYILKRNFNENSYQLILNTNDLKSFGVKDKDAVLIVSKC